MPEIESAQRPLVAIVGRPNVGKSTLFNRLTSGRMAIVESVPGVTRDRLYALAGWNGREFLLVDTGGITDARESLAKQVADQALLAAAEADVILFMVDARAGLLPLDALVADRLRRIAKPVFLVANKVENQQGAGVDFYPLGLGEADTISAEHGLGVGDLLDRLTAVLPRLCPPADQPGTRVAVVGRPNVGKSSLVNALLGVERVITSEEPGTTRDAIDTELIHEGEVFTLIDTAGIRRAARIEEAVEYYSVLRAIKAVERSDIAVLVMTPPEVVTEQDQRIAGIIQQSGRACLMLVNKWDLAVGVERDQAKFKERIRTRLSFLDYAPVEFVSAKTGRGIERIMPLVREIVAEFGRRISTSHLNEVVNEAVLVHEPPSYKGRKLRLFYTVQIRTKPPVIQIYVNDPGLVHFSYERYLENRLRQAFGGKGTPILLRFKARAGRKE